MGLFDKFKKNSKNVKKENEKINTSSGNLFDEKPKDALTNNMNFDEKINIIYGDNAQGKTNILESMYVCATSKSHRGSKDREIIRFDNDESHIKVNVKKNDMNYRIDMHLKKNKPKGIAVNGIPIKRAVELFGILNIVFFSPEDLNIIKNGPSERRRFIDMELSQLDKIYLDCLINYNKVVNQRNSLLKEYAFSGREDIILSLIHI